MIRLLIVDDERLEREGVKYLLAQENKEWRIYETANGKDALRILREEKIDLLLTDMFNMLSKNFVSKAVSADSFFNDYDDIIKYMDKLELVKDQKELDNVISYIFNTIGAIEVGKEEDKIVFNVKVNTLIISDPDSLKDFKKSMLGKEYITLDKNCLPELSSQDLEFYIVTVSNEVVSTDYYLITSNKNTTLHSI